MASSRTYIAVVDDEAPVRVMLRRVLRLASFDVEEFASGAAFLASLAARLPACVVLDVHMPGLTGLEVLARLRSTSAAVPIVLITASDDPLLDQTARDGGCASLLRKPFTTGALLAALDEAMGSKVVHDE